MRLYNTLTKNQENLQTLQEGKVGMYVCGPTVYASPHIGNARSVVIYDLLYRVLKSKYDVTYVRNITDVDDKINAAAIERKITIRQLTDEVEADFNSVMKALGCLEPTHAPRATEHIAEMVAMIEKLIANGNAYVAEGHVLFDVTSDKKYGHLSNRSQDEMIAGSRVEVAPYKKNAADFVLWKPAAAADDESAKFASPWGVGRPGWHIECSAMSTKYLGNDFDIHGGGADLTFPHHENEVAQSCCANKGSKYAHTWVHNGFLTVNGEKMSKSLGNVVDPMELLKNYPLDAVRYFLAREIPTGDDGDFSYERFSVVYSSDLANNYGNLVSRVVSMIHKYFEGVVPNLEIFKFEDEFQNCFKTYETEIENFDIKKGIEAVLNFMNLLNQYVEETKPWALAKENKIQELEVVMANLVEGVRRVLYLMNPFVPVSSQILAQILSVNLDTTFKEAFELNLSGVKLLPIEPLFPRLETN